MTTSEPKELSFSEATSELDGIVAFFEQRDVDVDQLVTKLERATAIIDELDRRLLATKTQVDELVPRLTKLSGDHGTSIDVDPESGEIRS